MIAKDLKIYRVNKDDYKFDGCNSNKLVLRKIIEIFNKKRPSDDKIEFENIPFEKIKNLDCYLYVHSHKEKDSIWAEYFPGSLTQHWNFSVHSSTVVFLIDNDIDIFLVIGGSGFQSIVSIIDHTFGIKVLAKIINPTEDKIISIDSRGLTGSRSGISEQFREEIRIIDYARFGKLPTKVHAIISKEIIDEFFSFLKSDENDDIKILVGRSFKVKKSLTFDELIKVIEQLQFIMERPENDFLSAFIQVSDRKFLDEQLRPLLLNAIYADLDIPNRTKEQQVASFKFDLCHTDKVVEFYSADRYVLAEKTEKSHAVFNENVRERKNIYIEVLKRANEVLPPDRSEFDFRTFIQGVRIRSFIDGKLASSGSFLFHFTAEFNLGGQPVFLIDNRWYRLRARFVKDLQEESSQIAKRYQLPSGILELEWTDNLTEGKYNLEYKDVDNHIVFDTITPDGIEMCDIMIMTENITYMVHLKDKFDTSIRALSNQIMLSARRVWSDMKTPEKNYINRNFDSYQKKFPEDRRYSIDDIIVALEKKIVYVFGFRSQYQNNETLVNNNKKYRSNVAKYSLIQCSKDLQEYMYELNFKQIKK